MEPSPVITEHRYLKLVTVSSFCPFTLLSVLMPLAYQHSLFSSSSFLVVPAGSPSRGRDATVCLRRKPTKLAYSFYSVFESVSVVMALSTVFHSINSPDESPLSDSVLPVFSLPYWSFQLYISL